MTRRLSYYLNAGIAAGLLLMLIEAIDRSIALAPHFSSSSERLLFVSTLALVPALNIPLSLFVALIVIALTALLTRVNIVKRVLERIERTRALLMAIMAVFAVIATACYLADAHLFVGRYLYYFHFPLALGAIINSFIFGMAAVPLLKQRNWIFVAAVVVVVVMAVSVTLGVGGKKAVQALFWRRGVIAKKYLYAAERIAGRDHFNFSSPTTDYRSVKLEDFKDINQAPLPEQRAQNILFITIDCLRADHLSCYNYARKVSPNIDRFAERALLFERASSLSTNTGHSFSGIARASYGEGIFDNSVPTVAEYLKSNGYRTAAITSPKTGKWLQKNRWEAYKEIMLKGVDEIVHKEGGYWDSKKLTNKTIDYLKENSDRPFYVWVHYNDPHAKNEKYVLQGSHNFGNDAIDIYDGNIAYTDEHLGRLFDYLQSSGLLDTTIIAISADHGEEFQEHGQQFHNGRPYREQTHVPLILWYPGVTPARVGDPVSTIDLGPTFLRAVGLMPPRQYDGLDLKQVAAGAAKGRKVYLETPRNVPQGDFFAWAVIDGDWRFIYDLVGRTYELYNDREDPAERRNLIDAESERARELSALLHFWLEQQSQHPGYRRWARF